MAKDPRVIVELVDPSTVLRKGESQKVFLQGKKTKDVVNEGWINKCIKAGILRIVPSTEEAKEAAEVDDSTEEPKAEEKKAEEKEEKPKEEKK